MLLTSCSCNCRGYQWPFVEPGNLALLNAKPENVRREAQIIAQAGLPGAVTIATNMAGRGTDIVLGGNPKGLALQALMKLFARYFMRGLAHNCMFRTFEGGVYPEPGPQGAKDVQASPAW